MKTFHKIGVGILLLIIISVGLLSFWWEGQEQKMYEDSLHHSYNYYIKITPNSNLSNVTLYLPIPVVNNSSSIGLDIVERHFNKDDPSWEYALVETEHGLMLSMTTDKIIPVFYSAPIDKEVPGHPDERQITYITSNEYSEETPTPGTIIDLSTTVFSNQTIGTLNPVGNSEVLMPKYDIKENPQAKKSHLELEYFPDARVYSYESMVYAQYNASTDANVQIYIELDARNEWWTGGWRSDNFRESIIAYLSGSQDGWTTVKGELITGEGIYREQ